MNGPIPDLIEIGGVMFELSPSVRTLNRAVVIIDWSNLSMSLRRIKIAGIVNSTFVSFNRLFRIIVPKGCTILEKYFVVRNRCGGAKAFIERIEKIGLRVICPWEKLQKGVKADDEMIRQLIEKSVCEDGANVVILVSGDGHFIGILEKLIRENNIRVIVACFSESTHMFYMSNDHIEFINLFYRAKEIVCEIDRRIRSRRIAKKITYKRRKKPIFQGKVRRR